MSNVVAERIRRKKDMNQTTIDTGRFDVAQIAATFPETATTLLVDHYLTNREAASARVFRVYKPTPPHYHATCDEYLYVFSGRGTFWMEDESTVAEFGPGELLFFKRGTVHAQPKILEDPVVFLNADIAPLVKSCPPSAVSTKATPRQTPRFKNLCQETYVDAVPIQTSLRRSKWRPRR
jgi:mannose-6-phosphate isomerase-like protein (cupin superfamily)